MRTHGETKEDEFATNMVQLVAERNVKLIQPNCACAGGCWGHL